MTETRNGLMGYLRAPFVLIVWVMETYAKNRARVKAFMATPRVSAVFAGVIALTVGVWIVIGMSADGQEQNRLTDAVKGLWSDTQELGAEKQRLDAIRQGEGAQ